MFLYREFGGDLWIKDSRERLATEISDRAPSLALMKQLQGRCSTQTREVLNIDMLQSLKKCSNVHGVDVL